VPRADLVFVLDASSSIEEHNFVLMKEFVVSVIESFSISQIGVRVAIVTYSDGAKVFSTTGIIAFDTMQVNLK
jgi:uncharacterized protein YegL